MTLILPDEAATAALGTRLADALHAISLTSGESCCIYLHGELGAGKTALARAILRQLGVTSRVRSPTYTLMERYPLPAGCALHMDLYRLEDPEELEFLGLRDAAEDTEILLVEWPEKGAGHLPAADIVIHLNMQDGTGVAAESQADGVRCVDIDSASPTGRRVLAAMATASS